MENYQVGFPNYDHETVDPTDVQDEYDAFVRGYFRQYDVGLPEILKIQYTPSDETEDTNRYWVECGRQHPDGTWEQSGIWKSGMSYFVGDDKKGYLINAQTLQMWETMKSFAMVERDSRKYYQLPRAQLLEYSILITYYKTIIIPLDGRYIKT